MGMFFRIVVLAGLFVIGGAAMPSLAADNDDVAKIFGRDPGPAAANACFVRHYSGQHLKAHPKQNVTDMALYVNKQEGPDAIYNLNLEVEFRHLKKPFNVSGSCSKSSDGKSTLGCGADCDGGFLDIRVKDQNAMLLDIPESVRIYDATQTNDDNEDVLPKNARFGSDDKLFRLDRAPLKDCISLIYDEETKKKVAAGEISD
jgi:hypothetical protein